MDKKKKTCRKTHTAVHGDFVHIVVTLFYDTRMPENIDREGNNEIKKS